MDQNRKDFDPLLSAIFTYEREGLNTRKFDSKSHSVTEAANGTNIAIVAFCNPLGDRQF